MLITTLFLIITLRCFAPTGAITICEGETVNPYERIWDAVCKIESSNDPLAYHMEENGFPSIGIAQIQSSRITDFNKRFRHSYTLMDMYQPKHAKIVFMAYASDFMPNDNESISRCWNGGEKGMQKKSTVIYWTKIKKAL
jgi:hypothetical protein